MNYVNPAQKRDMALIALLYVGVHAIVVTIVIFFLNLGIGSNEGSEALWIIGGVGVVSLLCLTATPLAVVMWYNPRVEDGQSWTYILVSVALIILPGASTFAAWLMYFVTGHNLQTIGGALLTLLAQAAVTWQGTSFNFKHIGDAEESFPTRHLHVVR